MILSSLSTPQPLVPSSTSLPATKGKKRARFVDENEDDRRDQIHKHRLEEPPAKKARAVEDAFEHLDASDNEVLCKGMYQTFIDTAFMERSNGQLDRYEQFLEQFQHLLSPGNATPSSLPSAPSISRIQRWLTTLTSVVSKLDRTHSVLVNKVLSLPWTVMDDQFVAVYSRFVHGLVSARSEWIHLVVEKIVQGMHYRCVPLEVRSSVLPKEISRRLIYQRLHSLLRSILRLVPTLPSILWPILESNYPNKRENRDAHTCYTANLLKITTYCDELMEQIVKLTIDRCVKLDVEIQVEVEDWEDDDGRLESEIFGKSVNEAFDKSWADEEPEPEDDAELDAGECLELDDLSSDDGQSSEEDEQTNAPSPASIRKVKELAAKLDGILRCILDHLQYMSFGISLKQPIPTLDQSQPEAGSSTPSPPASATPEPRFQAEKELFFDVLLSSFESCILRTQRTRHTQFIIFWYASVHPNFADSLLATLVECALYAYDDSTHPIVTRVASLGYIASLVSRARYIDKQTTRHVVSLLCARLEAGLVGEGNGNSYALWYSIAQAVFYIFCFRWKDLLVGEDEEIEDEDSLSPGKQVGRWLTGLKVLERAVSSHLNPLKACAPTVVSQFAKVAHQTNFIYCYNILRSNDRSGLNSSGSNKSLPPPPPTHSQNNLPPLTTDPIVRQVLSESRMDSFFPFDPCRLPLTSVYLEKIYRVWEGAPGDAEDGDDEEEEEDEED